MEASAMVPGSGTGFTGSPDPVVDVSFRVVLPMPGPGMLFLMTTFELPALN